MLLVVRNLPSDIKYSDIKTLIQSKCYVDEIILDKLLKDGPTTKQVTVGVAKDEDATRIMHRLNGTYVGGLKISVEPVKKSMSGNNSVMSVKSDFQGPNAQGHGYHQPSQGPWTAQPTGMSQYGTQVNQTVGYSTQQSINQQGVNQQMGYGYGAWVTSNNPAIPSLMQNSFMGYGNHQGQQGQQSSSSQGHYGDSAAGSQVLGVQKELGFGYSGNSLNDRERGRSNERGYGKDGGSWGQQERSNSQGSWRDAQQDRGRGSQGPWSTSRLPSNERDSRGYTSGNFEKDTRFGSSSAPIDSGGYGSQHQYDQRDRGFDSRGDWADSNKGSGGFDRSRGRDDLRGRDDRKRRHSPEHEGRYRADNRDRIQGGNSKFAGNQGRGFDTVRDSRDCFNRVAPPRDSYAAKPAPLMEQVSAPYSWANNSNTSSTFSDKPRPFGGNQSQSFENKSRPFGGNQSRSFERDQSRTFDEKPRPFGGDQSRPFDNKPGPSGPNRNDSKSRVVWNSKFQPSQPQNSPSRGPPAKRPKIEQKPAVNVVVKDYNFDQKTANRAISWRGEGVSALAKEIFQRQGPTKPLMKNQGGMKALKKALNSRIEQIIKEKFPNNPYPLLHGPDIVKLYREKYPPNSDQTLCVSCAKDIPGPGQAEQKTESKPNIATPASTVKPVAPQTGSKMPAQSGPKMPQPKPSVEVKPFPAKPKLSDLLPPRVFQQHPKGTLMLGPNALKNKKKPYNVEKRARSEQKQASKREFLDENMYKCPTPLMEKALNAVLDEITDVFNKAVDEHPTKNNDEKLIGEAIKQRVAPEFRAMMRLHTIKRILNITKTLMLRIFVTPGKASKENLEQALKPYGLLNLKASNQSKTPMYMAGVKTYYNYDRLCKTTGIPVQGKKGPAMITAKPLHLTIPFKFRRLLREKKYAEMTGDHDDNDFGGKIKEEDDEDDDDDDDDDELGDDDGNDDVVDVTKENDVIELSGDENAMKEEVADVYKSAESIKSADGNKCADVNKSADGNKCADGNKITNEVDKSVGSKNTVDLTVDDVELTVDEKMSAAIADEMGDSVVEIDEDEIREEDLEDY